MTQPLRQHNEEYLVLLQTASKLEGERDALLEIIKLLIKEHHAIEKGILTEDHQQKYSYRSKEREETQPSCSHCPLYS